MPPEEWGREGCWRTRLSSDSCCSDESSPRSAAEIAAVVGDSGAASASAAGAGLSPGVEHVRMGAGEGEREGGPGIRRKGSSSLTRGRARRVGVEDES